MEQPAGKTIRQIAAELGVSKQAVHQKRKSPELSTALRSFTSTVDGVVYISVDGVKLIKSAFSSVTVNDVDVNLRVNERKQVDGSLTAVLDLLKEQLAVKDKQLDAKDKQIEELHAQLSETTSALLSAQQTAQAAQALHAGTLQAQLTDGRDSDSPEAKKSFWARIFG